MRIFVYVCVCIHAFYFTSQTVELHTNFVQHPNVFGDDELAVVSQHSISLGQIFAPIRTHQRLAVNTDIGTFVFFMRGKVGDISDARSASFLDDMVVSLDCEFLFIGVMLRDIVSSTTQVKNTKTMLALIAEMSDDAIAWNLRLVITLETDVTGGMIRVPFGGIGLQLFVSGRRFLRSPRTTGQLVLRVGYDAL
jgi:hypothetical protein